MPREERKAFKYRDTSEETISKRATNTGNFDRFTKSKFPIYKVKDGENSGRILPRTWDDVERWGDAWGLPVKLHYSVGPDKGSYLCNKLNPDGDGTCYLCDERNALAKDPESKEASDELRPGDRTLVWWIDRDDQKAGPQIYGMPTSKVEVELQLLSKDKRSGEVLKIAKPKTGYDVSFTKTGSRMTTDYKGVRIAREPSPVHDKPEKMQEWLDFIEENPLPSTLNFYDNSYLEGVYGGKSTKKGRDDDEEEEDVRPAKKSKARDDDDDAEERPSRVLGKSRRDEEDEEEDAPKPKRARREEPEDEDEPAPKKGSAKLPVDEEEEDDPPPPKKGDRSKQAEQSVNRLKKKARVEEEEDDPPTKATKRTRRDVDEEED